MRYSPEVAKRLQCANRRDKMSSLVTEVNARKSLNIYKRNDYFTIRITFFKQTETTNLNQFCGRFGEKEFQQVVSLRK